MFDDIVNFLMGMNDSFEHEDELISEPSIDNYCKAQDERYKQAIELDSFKRRHARSVA